MDGAKVLKAKQISSLKSRQSTNSKRRKSAETKEGWESWMSLTAFNADWRSDTWLLGSVTVLLFLPYLSQFL